MPHVDPIPTSNAAFRYTYNLEDYTLANPVATQGADTVIDCLKQHLAARIASLVFAAVAIIHGIVKESTSLLDHVALAIANKNPEFLRNAADNLQALIIGTLALPIIGFIGFVYPKAGKFLGDHLDAIINGIGIELIKPIEVKAEHRANIVVASIIRISEDIRKITNHVCNILECPLKPEPREIAALELANLNQLRRERFRQIAGALVDRIFGPAPAAT